MLAAVFVVVVAILGGPIPSVSLVGIAGAAGDSGLSTIPDGFLSAILHEMTLEEKVGQLFVTYAYGSAPDTVDIRNRVEFGVETPEQVVEKYHLGGIIYFNWTESVKDPKQVAALSNGLQRAALSSGAHIPLMIATDQEQGIVARIGPPATQFPGCMALGAGRGTDDAQRAAAITGSELRTMGVNQDLAPVSDVNSNPANPIIGVRSFGSEPELVARLVRAQVDGYQRSNVVTRTVSATAKHFPGHGDASQDSHTTLPLIDHTKRQWEQMDAPPFQAAIDAGVDSIMTAHLEFPEIDPSGEPATLSPTIVTGLLRNELGYDGVVVTDALQMQGVRTLHNDAEIPVLALRAGVDELLMPQDLGLAITGVMTALRSGQLTEERVDRSVTRVLRMKWRRGVFRAPLVDVNEVDGAVGTPQHLAAAQRVTDRTTTLVRNDAGLLPLTGQPKRVLVTGWGDSSTQALAERIAVRGPDVGALPTGATPTVSDIAAAVGAAKGVDLVIVLTNALSAHPEQQELLREMVAAGVPVVAVAVRNPYDVDFVESETTWLATYSYTPVALESLSRVLFGEVRPQGKLPVNIPFADDPTMTRYPFGYGLSW